MGQGLGRFEPVRTAFDGPPSPRALRSAIEFSPLREERTGRGRGRGPPRAQPEPSRSAIEVQPPPGVLGEVASLGEPEGAPADAAWSRPRRDRILPSPPLRGGEGPGERGPRRAQFDLFRRVTEFSPLREERTGRGRGRGPPPAATRTQPERNRSSTSPRGFGGGGEPGRAGGGACGCSVEPSTPQSNSGGSAPLATVVSLPTARAARPEAQRRDTPKPRGKSRSESRETGRGIGADADPH